MTLTAVLVSLGEAKNLCPFMFTPMRSQTLPLIPVNSPAISLKEISAGLNPSLLYVDFPLIFAAILITFSHSSGCNSSLWTSQPTLLMLEIRRLTVPLAASGPGIHMSHTTSTYVPLPRLISTQPCTDVGEQEEHPLRKRHRADPHQELPLRRRRPMGIL